MTIKLKVLDLSHHNDGPHGGAIDFAAIAAFGVKGIIHKSSQGLANIDAQYARRRDAAINAGLLWGAYHFADGSDPLAQARHFLDAARPDSGTLVALDFEPNGDNTMMLAGCRAFLQAVEDALGRKAVLYSGNLIKETLGNQADVYLGEHRLWLAHYNDNPRWPPAWVAPWLHQFSGDGVNAHGIQVPGVNAAQAGQLDMNSFAGSDDDLAAQWAA
jgi:GH25 family lysozyme M1 (1,4-beta-N-acetylmuramidase)